MGGSSLDGGGKRQKRKGKGKHHSGRGAKKIKSRHTAVKTPSMVDDSDSGSGKEDASGDEKEYIVEDILDKKREYGVWKYYIKWLGWSHDTNTWEPVENLTGCDELLRKFEEEWNAKQDNASGSSADTLVLSKGSHDKHGKKRSDKQESSLPPINLARADKKSDKAMEVDKISDEEEDYEDLDVLEECPVGRIPNKIIGVVPIADMLVYCVEWKPVVETSTDEPVSLVRSTIFRETFPAMVIQFYEDHIVWAKDRKAESQLFENAEAVHKAIKIETTDRRESSISKSKIGSVVSNGKNDSSDESDGDKPLAKFAKKHKSSYNDDSDDNQSKENYPN